jgi:zinc transport system ATP-binding protein
MSMIACRDLSLGYDSDPILEHLCFEVNAGDYLCIVGENGSGKSTLMRTVLGLQRPLGGEITFGEGVKPGEIGYLPQQTAIQRDFPATVWEVALSGCQARLGRRAFYSRSEKALAAANLARMGMGAMGGRCYRELSGGQQQRVLLARALCAAGRLLLLDEPVAGLDPGVTQELYGLIGQLNRDGVTIVMISHDISAAMRYATHMLHVGKQLFFGSAGEYRQSALGRRFLAEGGED